jgi:hypothetical protein
MYKIAIPTYKRYNIKTLDLPIKHELVYIFVANDEEYNIYIKTIPKDKYHKIIVGELGITNQRNFIRNYFNDGENIVSIDDDIEKVVKWDGYKGHITVDNLDELFILSFKQLSRDNLNLWGINSVANPFFMSNKKEHTTNLKFCVGCMFGFINDKSIMLNTICEGKEDYENTFLSYEKCGGVFRMNWISVKQKPFSKGGLGSLQERIITSKKAAEYLQTTYPNFVSSIFTRKNGMNEIRLRNLKCVDNIDV